MEGGFSLDEVHEILGIRQCSPLEMSDTQRAEGLAEESLQPCFLVRGQYEHNAPYADEEPSFMDTRWVGFQMCLTWPSRTILTHPVSWTRVTATSSRARSSSTMMRRKGCCRQRAREGGDFGCGLPA
eukprot:6249812-Prymnesium_polylepis.1